MPFSLLPQSWLDVAKREAESTNQSGFSVICQPKGLSRRRSIAAFQDDLSQQISAKITISICGYSHLPGVSYFKEAADVTSLAGRQMTLATRLPNRPDLIE